MVDFTKHSDLSRLSIASHGDQQPRVSDGAHRVSVVKKLREPFHYTQCGLDNVWLLNGFTRGEYGGQPTFSIKDIDGLHRAIGLALINTRKALSPKEWRFLRKQMDMTQSTLAEELDLSSQQVARYEKGESEINGPAEFAFRVLFLMSACKGQGAELGYRLENLRERLRTLRKSDEIRPPQQKFKVTGVGWRMEKAA
jgi:DNA-binding transcriptional regulator YiaG